MKKSVKTTTKPKEFVSNDYRSRPLHHRSESSLVKPSLHPWYYVKGRPDLTEKNISSRRERDEQKHRQSVTNSQYYDKRSAEAQVYRNWTDNKSLIKHPKHSSNYSLKPPYDVSDQPKAKPRINLRQNKELEKKYSKAKQKLTEFMQKFKELDENYIKLEKKQNTFVFQLKEMRKIKTTFKEKTQFYQMVTNRLINSRFNRDKMRKKVFYIIDILNHYKTSVESIKLLKNCDGVFTKEESIQLKEVIERALKIIDMYIELNRNRNEEFVILFDEEVENLWETQVIEWKTEYEIWSSMTEKLIHSFINVIKEKLSQLLSQQTTALKERQQTLKELSEFADKIKSDAQLSTLMTENIEDFLIEVNLNNS